MRTLPNRAPVAAVFFDRDGTLVHGSRLTSGVAHVWTRPGAAMALERLRHNGIAVGVMTHESSVGRGDMSADELAAVNAMVELLLGPFDTWQVCTHTPEDECACSKPQPALVTRAAAAVGVPPDRCAVIGDTGEALEAGRAAGARTVLVPTSTTLANAVADAPVVARDLLDAVEVVLDWARRRGSGTPDTP